MCAGVLGFAAFCVLWFLRFVLVVNGDWLVRLPVVVVCGFELVLVFWFVIVMLYVFCGAFARGGFGIMVALIALGLGLDWCIWLFWWMWWF